MSVHDRLFNDSILKQEMLEKLLNNYLLNEEEKYTFYPKINTKNISFNEYYDRRMLALSDRNMRSRSYNNIYSLNESYPSYYNKYMKNLKRMKNGANSTSSLSCSNINLSDLNSLYNEFNNNYSYKPVNKKIDFNYKKNSIPISTKYNYKLYNSLFNGNEEHKDKNIYQDNNNYLNKTSSSFYRKIYNGKANNNNNNIVRNKKYYFHFNNNTNKDNKELYKKNQSKNKNAKKNNSQKICILPKNSENFVKNNRNLIHTSDISYEESSLFYNYKKSNELNEDKYSFIKNNNSSLYNISSIGGSVIKENNKNKSPDKKEYLYSFGTDLNFNDDNNINNINSNSKKNLINKSLIEKLQKKNDLLYKKDRRKNTINNKIITNRNDNKIKTNTNSIKSKSNINSLSVNNHISTNYSGSNSKNNIKNNINNNGKNNINGYISKKNGNNGKKKDKDKISQLKIQSTNEYFILNDKKEDFNFHTTIQTLSDSKILDLANDYMSEDNSLESYKKTGIIYNKKHKGNNESSKK